VSDQQQPEILTRYEVMKYLRIGKNEFNNLVNTDPEFKTIKLNHRRMMRRAALEKWLKGKEGS